MKDENENMPVVYRVAIAVEVYGALASTLEHNSGDMKALWSQSIYLVYIYMYATVQCRQCRKTY